MTIKAALAAGTEALHLDLDAATHEKLLQYVALIDKWNRVYNLTAVRAREQMVTQHLLDSLAVAPHLSGTTLLDVGSGAGLPGIPLALARPAWRVTLLESNQKKSAFLQQAVIELALANVEVAHARVEEWVPAHAYDVVISRAFSDLAEFMQLAGRHVAPGGMLAAMKGAYPADELARVPAPFRTAAVIPLEVPGLGAERHLVVLRKD